MRLPIVILLILLAVNSLVDLYIWRGLRRRAASPLFSRIYAWSWGLLSVLWGVIFLMPSRGGSDRDLDTLMWLLVIYMSVYIPKYFFVLFDLAARLPELWHRQRIKPISMIGFILAVAVFAAIWWGTLVNRYRTCVVDETVFIPDLPAAFEGYRIVQFSDFHVGTYGRDTTFVSKVVSEINDLHPDMIVFTGDIVSRRTSELLPFTGTLSHLQAPDGVYSILGNHDYGDYYNWKTPEAKECNMTQMYELQNRMGWRLLNNDHAVISRDNDSIVLIGVENIGDPPFPVYGDLAKAYPTVGDDLVKILLTHNPAHWDAEIADRPDINIALSLSGHTHAMQMSMLGKSPAVMRYRRWGGHYLDKDGSHQLYVNIGVGTVGIPMRIGATPEITLLTLRRGHPSVSSDEN